MTSTARILVLAAAFLGWYFAGMQLGVTSIAMRSASIDLLSESGEIERDHYLALVTTRKQAPETLSPTDEAQLKAWNGVVQRWIGWLTCAFLFGAAAGGWIFGRLGDRIGRSRALGCAVLCFSSIALACHLATSQWMLLGLWFLSCMGVGGTWPNGVALISEFWSSMSRPVVAGVMGAAANIGIFVMGLIGKTWNVTPTDWRWVMLISALPLALSIAVFLVVPESPRWIASRTGRAASGGTTGEVFRPPFLGITLVGIVLATVPLVGGWGSANWMVHWADETSAGLKADVLLYRSLTGIFGSFLGGWVASRVGRRRAYAGISLGALLCAQYTFWFLVPGDASFLWWVAALGVFNGLFFGWLPFFLPELFPTRIRATGSGVSFNFGRILTASTVFTTAALIRVFDGSYANIGRVTSLVFAVGVVAICFAPDTTRSQLDEEIE